MNLKLILAVALALLLLTSGPALAQTEPTPTPTATPRPTRTPIPAETATPTATATATPEATPSPAPAVNQPPVAAISSGCGAGVVCSGLVAREQKPHTFDATPSHDPDGTIVRYDWDLDGADGFEATGGPAITHTFEHYKGLVDPGKRTVRLRVTDDAGATAETTITLRLLEPACESTVVLGRLRATGLCLRRHDERWASKDPITVNGITITPWANRTVTVEQDRIASNGAGVTVTAKGAPATLVNGAFSWGLKDGIHLTEVKPTGDLNGLKITAATAELSADKTSSKLGLRVALPSQFGGPTSDEPIVVTPGKAAAAASGALHFGVRNASIGPIGLDHLDVAFDGEDLWTISAAVKLPPPIPYVIEGDAGIRDGAFEHAGAGITFGTPGIGPLGPVFLQRIAFRVEIKPKQSKCVPKVGVEHFDQRKLLHDITGRWFDVPNFDIDHGIPTFALCGEVGLTAGPTVLGAAAVRLDAGLGLATYDDRPAVFRAFGNVKLVEIPLAQADLELHTNGYTRMGARFDWGIDGLATLKGGLQFELLAPRFNATAHVDACLEFIDWCAGARAIVSSKGVAVCLKIDVIFDDWEPGFGYRWGEPIPTLYLAGCDVGEYKEHISSGIDEHITAVPAQVANEHVVEFPAGLPGATIVARGKGAPPKLTLIGPKGERVTSPDDLRPVQQAPFLVLKDPRAGLTQFAIAKPSAGRWRVVVEPGSAPLLSLKSAEGLDRPEIKARVAGHGQRRTLVYDTDQPVTFLERGPSAGNRIGVAGRGAGRLPFHPAAGVAERRTIVAIVEGRGEYEVARYTAPAAARPGRVRGLKVSHRGGRVRVTWKDAGLHEATIRLSDGRRLVKQTRKRSITVPGVTRATTGTVSVRARFASGVSGRRVSMRVR